MPFKPGLELIEASFFDAAPEAFTSVTFVEGPLSEEQFTLHTSTLIHNEIKCNEIEVVSTLFPEMNYYAHENHPASTRPSGSCV
jgi:hypothetical protein